MRYTLSLYLFRHLIHEPSGIRTNSPIQTQCLVPRYMVFGLLRIHCSGRCVARTVAVFILLVGNCGLLVLHVAALMTWYMACTCRCEDCVAYMYYYWAAF